MGQITSRSSPFIFIEMATFDPDFNYNQTCNVVLTRNSTLIEINGGWEGIPEALIINVTFCIILMCGFLIVRKFARKDQLLNNNSMLQFIYGDRIEITNPDSNRIHISSLNHSDTINSDLENLLPMHIEPKRCVNRTVVENVSPFVSEPNLSTCTSTSPISATISPDHESSKSDTTHESVETNSDNTVVFKDGCNGYNRKESVPNILDNETTFPARNDNQLRFFRSDSIYRFNNWILNMSQLEMIRQIKGPDAYQYLLFQQYIIFLLAITSFISMVILLPINAQGVNEGRAFARTTLGNLSHDSNLYWFHAIFATLIVILGVYFMNYFSKVLRTEDDLMSRTTLLLRRLPTSSGGRNNDEINMKELLLNYFRTNFPQIKITGIQFIYNYQKLQQLEQQFVNVMNAKQHCEHLNQMNNQNGRQEAPATMRPYALGRFVGCCCCCCCSKVNSVEYYSNEKIKINNEINTTIHRMATSVPCGAFVSMENERMAMEVYTYFKEEQRKPFLCRACLACYCDQSFDLRRSLISYAPYPYDINWLNIGIDMKLLWLRKIAISLILFLIFFFLSTPAFLLKAMELSKAEELLRKGIGKLGSTFTDFLSPFLMMILSIILPSIVNYACQLIPYKTISALNHAIMSKVFAFLLMMILILPSAGFLSINAMLEDILAPENEVRKFRWNCLFPVDNGAFFVIYTLQAAILGNTVELLRLPELCQYILYSVLLKSDAEYRTARKMVTFEFPFGVSYPRFLLIFTITITYSLACPLIAPCGLLYMICKHLVDRYNIYHVYTPSKINGRIHSTAMLYVHISLIMMLFQLFTFLLTKTQYSHVTLFLLVVLLISLLVFSLHCFYHWFRNINHLTYSVTTSLSRTRPKHNFCICSYKPIRI